MIYSTIYIDMIHEIPVLATCNYMELTCKCMEVDLQKCKNKNPISRGSQYANHRLWDQISYSESDPYLINYGIKMDDLYMNNNKIA